MNFKIFFSVLICLILFFFAGYKMGDSWGYEAGYNEGYLYDCKAEINTIYDRVISQSKALSFTDSAIKSLIHENDSLKRKEYFQKRFEDSIAAVNQYFIDSIHYAKVARIYSDSLNKAVNGSFINIIQANGQVNRTCIMLPKYRNLNECKDGFNIKSRLDSMLKPKKKAKVKK